MPGWLGRHFGMKCDNCRLRGYMRETGRTVVKRVPGYQTVTRKKRIRNSEGEVVRTEEYEEQIHVVRTTVRTDYVCSNCGNRASYDSTRTKEG